MNVVHKEFDFPRPVSHSSLTDFEICMRKGYWSFLRKVKPVVKSPPLNFGGAVHAGVEVLAMKGSLVDAKKAALLEFDDAAADWLRTLDLCFKILEAYYDKYKDDGLETIWTEKWLAAELAEGLVYVGKIDRLVNHPGVGKFIMETKTQRTLKVEAFDPNHQIVGYYFLMSLLEDDIQGVYIDLVQVAKTKQELIRVPIIFRKGVVEDFITSRVRIYERILRALDRYPSEEFPMETSGCHYYKCPYIPLCRMPIPPSQLIPPKGLYREDSWNIRTQTILKRG